MRCLVTGGAGFIGSNLVDKLINDGNEVIIFDNLSTCKRENINPKAKFFLIDISNPSHFKDKKIKDIMTEVDVVFHLAAMARVQPSIEDPIAYHNVNVNGTLNLLKACVDYGVNRFVFSSSSSIYGDVEEKDLPTSENSNLNPMSPYALHKLIGEQYCKLFSKLHNIKTICLRYFNVYGDRQPTEGAYCLVMGVFAQQLLNNKPMTIRGDGEQRRDFVHVDDVVDANILASKNDEIFNEDIKCRAFNIGFGDNKSVNQIAKLMGDNKITVKPVIEPRQTLADNNKARKLLNWIPSRNLENWLLKWKNKIGINNKMNKFEIKNRINYLKTELVHHGYHDGWTIKGMKKELKELIKMEKQCQK